MATGVNGTPMPSFSDAWNSEDLWHLANYLHTIGREPTWGEILQGPKIDAVPDDPFDDAWNAAPQLDIRLPSSTSGSPGRPSSSPGSSTHRFRVSPFRRCSTPRSWRCS